MRLVIGIDNPAEVNELVKLGADEFYVGIVPREWSCEYGFAVAPNRRETARANLTGWDELGEVLCVAHGHRRQVFLTVNAHEYPPSRLKKVRALVLRALDLGVDGLIVADLALLLHLERWGIRTRTVLSGDTGLVNSRALAWISDIGTVERVILPRHLSARAMAAIIQRHPAFEYEAFLLRERCFFAGSHCHATHGIYTPNLCSRCFDAAWTVMGGPGLSYELWSAARRNVEEFRTRERLALTIERCAGTEERQDAVPCGLCSLPRLSTAGVKHLKIVTRGAEFSIKRHLLNLAVSARASVRTPAQARELYCGAFSNHYPEICRDGFPCYRFH